MKKYLSNVPFEVQLKEKYSPDAFVNVESKHTSLQIPLFQKATGAIYFRYANSIGEYTYSTDKERGTFSILPYKGANQLFKNGPIRLSDTKSHFAHANGTPFFYLADTWWYGVTNRAIFSTFCRMTRKRLQQGFTAIQLVVGIPPETSPFSKDAQNEGGHPFKKDLSLNKAYFDVVDRRIQYLVSHGIVPVIFGGWGHHIDILGIDKTKTFWRELVARYSAYPVIFSLSGELDVFLTPPKFLSPASSASKSYMIGTISKFSPKLFNALRQVKHKIVEVFVRRVEKGLLQTRIRSWSAVGSYVHHLDSFRRPMTGHTSMMVTATNLFKYPDFFDFDGFQSGHEKDRAFFIVDTIIKSKSLIINLEPWYEGILGNFGPYEQRMAFWYCVLSGAKGYSYGAHGIWQMASSNDNFMGHWGPSRATSSIAFHGAAQISLAKKYLMKLPWENLVPTQSIISPSFSSKDTSLPLAGQIGEDHYLIYFPDVNKINASSICLPKGKFIAGSYDPITMQRTHTFEITASSTLLKPDTYTSPDMVVCITKK